MIRVKINDIPDKWETLKTTETINKTKSWFTKDKVHQPLVLPVRLLIGEFSLHLK